MKFWESIPAWTRGLIILVLILAFVGAFFAFKKYVKTTTDEAEQQKKANPATAVKASSSELLKLKSSPNKNLRPRYSSADYKKWADQLFAAMNQMGTKDSVITNVFSNMYNRADVLSLIDAYGLRELKFFGLTQSGGGSTNLIQDLTEEGALEAARKGLKTHNVYYQL